MKKVLIAICSSVLLFSCGDTTEQTDSKATVATHDDHKEAEKNQERTELRLNDGKKWEVNKEMAPYITTPEQSVNVFLENKQTDYSVLAEKLKEQNSELIKSCTMKGPDHDELHVWLYPHLALVKKLEQETDPAKSQEIVLQLQKSYHNYHQFFN